jgi:hypothetical protein
MVAMGQNIRLLVLAKMLQRRGGFTWNADFDSDEW